MNNKLNAIKKLCQVPKDDPESRAMSKSTLLAIEAFEVLEPASEEWLYQQNLNAFLEAWPDEILTPYME